MIRKLNLYRFYLRLVCYLLPALSFGIAGLLRSFFGQQFGSLELYGPAYIRLLVITTIVWAATSEHYGVASPEQLMIRRTGLRSAFKAATATYLLLLTILFFYREVAYSRVFLALSSIVLLLLAAAVQGIFWRMIRSQTGVINPIRVLVVGADAFARRAARRLVRSAAWFRIVGFVRIPGQQSAALKAPVYDLEELASLELGHGIDDVLIAIPPERLGSISQILIATEKFCAPVHAVVDLGKGVFVQDRLFRFGSLHLLDLVSGATIDLDYIVWKRVFDVAFSLSVIVIALPIMITIALAIRLTSPGPLLFVQERVGLNGRTFKMYKFRTMSVSSLTESDSRWTTASDPRRTGLGALLRKTSLDELPQFFNVLQGNMSVVGPRPERPFFVKQFVQDVAHYHSRHQLKVGITGWAQVNGLRGDTSISHRIECDLYYLQNWSFMFDVRIILLTLWTGVFGSNAY